MLSAIGLRQVMLEPGPLFERATGYKLAVTFTSTGQMATRVASGEAVDVVMINQSSLQTLEKEGRLIAGSRTPGAQSVDAVAAKAPLNQTYPRLTHSSPAAVCKNP